MKARFQLIATAVILVLGTSAAVAAAPHHQATVSKERPAMSTKHTSKDKPTEAAPVPDAQPPASGSAAPVEPATPSPTTPADASTTAQVDTLPPVQPALPSQPVYIGNNTYVAPGSPTSSFTMSGN